MINMRSRLLAEAFEELHEDDSKELYGPTLEEMGFESKTDENGDTCYTNGEYNVYAPGEYNGMTYNKWALARVGDFDDFDHRFDTFESLLAELKGL